MNRNSFHRPPLLAAAIVSVALLLTAGCGIAPSSPPGQSEAEALRARLDGNGDALRWAVEYYDVVQRMNPSETAREWTRLKADGDVLATMQQVILLSHPRGSDAPRALALLESVLAAQTPEAVALHPFARLLSQQLAERQRLETTSERLTRQLERTGQELKETRHLNQRLQEKLDALTEIERSLPARPPATPLPTMPDRRN